MRILKLAMIVSLALVATGCACRTKKVGPGDGNIGYAEAGKELKDVSFAFDSYEIDNTAKGVLQQNYNWLQANEGRKVQIEGHCDDRGTNEYNMVLGANRARATMDYLRSLGVDAGRMSTVSYGEELPLDPRHTEEAWAKNRRAHFNLQ